MTVEQLEFPLVALEPCPSFRIPIAGDLFNCAACGWWINEHPGRDIETEECE